jgi:hypothetical protein
MGDISNTIMKFERLMGHSHDELMEIGRQPKRQVQPNPGEIIATRMYNPTTGEETFTSTENYKKKTRKYSSTK